MKITRVLVVGAALVGLIGCSPGDLGSSSPALASVALEPALSNGESPATVLGAVRVIEPSSAPRSHHTATPLPEGKILIAGGHDGYSFLKTAEVYDPATGAFRETEPMREGRAYHSAIRVNGLDGRPDTPDDLVIVAGGYNGEALASVEIYYAQEGRFYPMYTDLPQPLHRHGAVLVPGPYDEYGRRIRHLPPGNQVLMVGGATQVPGGEVAATNSAILYSFDPEQPNASFCSIAASPHFARVGHTVTAFVGPRGSLGSMVLVYGGEGAPADSSESTYQVLAAPEVYRVTTNTWTRLEPAEGPLPPRTNHRAARLGSGDILLVGGFGGEDETGAMDLATVFRPNRREIARSEFLSVPGPGTLRQSPEITGLPGGSVLLTGGFDGQEGEILSSVEVFLADELGGEFHPGEGMFSPRVHHTASYTPGRDGRFNTGDDEVIIVGGRGGDPLPHSTAEARAIRPVIPNP